MAEGTAIGDMDWDNDGKTNAPEWDAGTSIKDLVEAASDADDSVGDAASDADDTVTEFFSY